MITLQDTAGNDQNVVWVLKTHSEGTNQVTNGNFTSTSGWSTSGDWDVTGTNAEYSFSANATGTLSRTISAVSAAHYIFEYEVKTSVGTFTLVLSGGGADIVASDVSLPVTVGEHRLSVFCVASKTNFAIDAAGFGGSDDVVIDNLSLRKADETAYLSTVALSLNNTYDNKVLQFDDRISDINEFMDVQGSGSIAGVSSFIITITRHNANTKYDGFFNEFFPDEEGGIIIARDIEVGMVWDNASTDTEITWLMRGRVIDYRYTPATMIITILQSTEIDSRPLPFYTVQKDFNNGVSYFTNAPDGNYGLPLPIVYGAFNLYIDTKALFRPLFAPLVLVEKHKLQYVAATHKLETDNMSSGGASNVFRYLDGIKTLMTMICLNGSSTNNDIRALVTTFDSLNSSDNVVLGTINIRPTLPGTNNDITTYDNLINDDNTDEITLTPLQEVALQIEGSETNIGIISSATGSVTIRAVISDSSPADASTDTSLHFWNPKFNNGAGGYGSTTGGLGWNTGDGDKLIITDFSTFFTSRDISDEPWRATELFDLEYIIRALTTYTNKYKELWLRIDKIVVTDARKIIREKVIREALPFEHEGRTYLSTRIENLVNKTVFDSNFKPIDNAFGKLEGREYGRWIDFATAAGGTRDTANGGANDPGFAENALITTPAYIIESLLRDELFVERELQITSSADSTHFVCTDVLSRVDDYYNNAEIYNATTLAKSYVTDYTGSTATFTINDADGSMAASDNFFLTNIQGDAKIDTNSFDTVGNETNGTRRSLLSGTAEWVFTKSVNVKLSLETIINQLCFESHSMLFESVDPDTASPQIKIVAIDAATSGDTWTSPLKNLQTGLPMVNISLTPLTNLFTSFKIFYHWNYAKQEYEKEWFVDENGTPSAATVLDDYEQLLCRKAKATYRVEKPFEYSANWIYNDNTAERMLQKKIRYFTKQRLIVNWSTPISDGTFDYITYERGDQVKLNYTKMIPAGLNNSSFFMITSKRMVTVQGSPLINFQLLEM